MTTTANFQNIRVLIWDIDGTLYKPNPLMWQEIFEASYKTIMVHTGWSRTKSISKFESIYPNVTTSQTSAVSQITGLPVPQVAVESELYKDRKKFLKRDPQLIRLFQKLSKYQHFILANGIIAKTLETIEVLGLEPKIFKTIVTSEIVGVNKPDPLGFKYILKSTKLSPEKHLMIGDREKVDLEPAKKLGMKTCLVWTKTKSQVADITLPILYELADILRARPSII